METEKAGFAWKGLEWFEFESIQSQRVKKKKNGTRRSGHTGLRAINSEGPVSMPCLALSTRHPTKDFCHYNRRTK